MVLKKNGVPRLREKRWMIIGIPAPASIHKKRGFKKAMVCLYSRMPVSLCRFECSTIITLVSSVRIGT
jgi:hypothetical protein